MRVLHKPRKKSRLNYRRVIMSPQKKTFGGFKRPKVVRGTSGRSVNIDFRFLRIFLRIETLIKIDFRGVHANPFFRLYYMLGYGNSGEKCS